MISMNDNILWSIVTLKYLPCLCNSYAKQSENLVNFLLTCKETAAVLAVVTYML